MNIQQLWIQPNRIKHVGILYGGLYNLLCPHSAGSSPARIKSIRYSDKSVQRNRNTNKRHCILLWFLSVMYNVTIITSSLWMNHNLCAGHRFLTSTHLWQHTHANEKPSSQLSAWSEEWWCDWDEDPVVSLYTSSSLSFSLSLSPSHPVCHLTHPPLWFLSLPFPTGVSTIREANRSP